MSGSELTPMMAQYQAMRKNLPADIILLYRLGDFYEMFFDDAKIAAPILNVALTKRHLVPMCGIPWHASDSYLAKLLKAGKRVAIAEQTSDPKPGKLVEREISRILTPGSLDDATLLDTQQNNYLAAVNNHGSAFGLACIDHSTGSFSVAQFSSLAALEDELARLQPAELLIPTQQTASLGHLSPCQPYDDYAFLISQAQGYLTSHFGVHSLDGFGCASMSAAIGAAGAALHYLIHQLRRPCAHLRHLHVRDQNEHVWIDAASQRNLDLIDSRSGKQHTLLGVMDRTHTPMGARLLRDWLLHPCRDLCVLESRQESIALLLHEPSQLDRCREVLKGVRDIERSTSRLSQGAGNARDLQALGLSLQQIPRLQQTLLALAGDRSNAPHVVALAASLRDFSSLCDTLQRALADDLPAQLKDGGIIRSGWSADLDELRSLAHDGKNWMAQLQATERERTGIDSLKIKFNNVFGYFIEITATHAARVPSDYIRKQTLANVERFITPALKEMEQKVLGSEERAHQLEYELFQQLRHRIADDLDALQHNAQVIAQIDVICGLADLALHQRHTRPRLSHGKHLHLNNARHPVLEQTLKHEPFVPNDTAIDAASQRVHILTGPNMAGKSTYIRQVALITIMAQMGAYVPAEAADIGLVDRIFCRVGASDDLTRGQSTFMVEMNETALILNNATSHSLVILDEIGRGTATFDGLSIAWAVAEHLHDAIECRTLFATHYHELTDLSLSRPAVANYHVAVREWNEEIIFLRKILPGCADKSYGIQVARLAGLPTGVIDRAKSILSHLEMQSQRPQGHHVDEPAAKRSAANAMPRPPTAQLDLFADFHS